MRAGLRGKMPLSERDKTGMRGMDESCWKNTDEVDGVGYGKLDAEGRGEIGSCPVCFSVEYRDGR